MDKAQQIDELTRQFNQTSLNASKVASKDLILGGQFVAHDKAIKEAISGKLSSSNYNKVVNWIVKQVPYVRDAFSFSIFFENAWMVYTVSKLNGNDSDEWLDREDDFVTDVRSQLLAKYVQNQK